MSKPLNYIKEIKMPDNTKREIIPSRLTDGTTTYSLPSIPKEVNDTIAMLSDLEDFRKSSDQDAIDNGIKGRLDVIEGKEAGWDSKSTVSASETGTSTTEAKYLTIDDVEYKLPEGGQGIEYTGSETTGKKVTVDNVNHTIELTDMYAGGTAVTLNGSSKAGSTASFYAPTDYSIAGYELVCKGSSAPVWKKPSGYLTCNTAGSTYKKSVTYNNFYLIDGARVVVKFTYATTSTSTAQLNINSTGAKSMYWIKDGNAIKSTNSWKAGAYLDCMYDGLYWKCVEIGTSDVDLSNYYTKTQSDDRYVSKSQVKTEKSTTTGDTYEVNYLNNELANIREVASGKETGYVINTLSEISYGEDQGERLINVTSIVGIDFNNVKLGDNIYIIDTNVPDYWVSGKTNSGTETTPTWILTLNRLLTKVDLTTYNNHINNNTIHVTSQDKENWNDKTTVSVSATGTVIDEIEYITIDGVEKKIKSGGETDSYTPISGTKTINGYLEIFRNEISYTESKIYLGDKHNIRTPFIYSTQLDSNSYSFQLINKLGSSEIKLGDVAYTEYNGIKFKDQYTNRYITLNELANKTTVYKHTTIYQDPNVFGSWTMIWYSITQNTPLTIPFHGDYSYSSLLLGLIGGYIDYGTDEEVNITVDRFYLTNFGTATGTNTSYIIGIKKPTGSRPGLLELGGTYLISDSVEEL